MFHGAGLLFWQCVHCDVEVYSHVAYLANSNIGEAVVACVPLLNVQLEGQNELCQTVDSVTHSA